MCRDSTELQIVHTFVRYDTVLNYLSYALQLTGLVTLKNSMVLSELNHKEEIAIFSKICSYSEQAKTLSHKNKYVYTRGPNKVKKVGLKFDLKKVITYRFKNDVLVVLNSIIFGLCSAEIVAHQVLVQG